MSTEFRSLLPLLAVTLLFPVPLLNFVQDGAGRAFAFAYLFLGGALLAAECFRPLSAPIREESPHTSRERGVVWRAKMSALVVAMMLAVASFCVFYWAISGELKANTVALAFLVMLPCLGIVPYLTLLLRSPYVAVLFASLLLFAVKLAGCVLARVVYGPNALAEGYMAMSWDRPNLLVWFCLVGGLLCSGVSGIMGYRVFSCQTKSSAA